MVWLVALAVTWTPGLTAAGLIVGISKRGLPFWLTGLLALVASVAAQYWVALRPFVQSGTYDITLMTVPLFTWHLGVPAVLAAILWFGLKARQKPVLAGATAGLVLSIPVVAALALPMTFWLPRLPAPALQAVRQSDCAIRPRRSRHLREDVDSNRPARKGDPMGYIMMALWVGALAITGVPGLTLAGIVISRSARGWSFWLAGLVALTLSGALQYETALYACHARPVCGVELIGDMIWTWRLAVPLVLAYVLWFPLKARGRPALAGATAGLILSVIAVVALAFPAF